MKTLKIKCIKIKENQHDDAVKNQIIIGII